jgi:hypothetical protein
MDIDKITHMASMPYTSRDHLSPDHTRSRDSTPSSASMSDRSEPSTMKSESQTTPNSSQPMQMQQDVIPEQGHDEMDSFIKRMEMEQVRAVHNHTDREHTDQAENVSVAVAFGACINQAERMEWHVDAARRYSLATIPSISHIICTSSTVFLAPASYTRRALPHTTIARPDGRGSYASSCYISNRIWLSDPLRAPLSFSTMAIDGCPLAAPPATFHCAHCRPGPTAEPAQAHAG